MYADIKAGFSQVDFQSAPANDLHNWTAPVAVAPSAADQFEGELSVAPNGRIDTSFYDRSYSANRLVDVTQATSSDGGITWRKARVSTAGFDPGAWGVPSGNSFRPFIGDYNGMISTNDFAGITWTGVAPPQPFNLEIEFAKVSP